MTVAITTLSMQEMETRGAFHGTMSKGQLLEQSRLQFSSSHYPFLDLSSFLKCVREMSKNEPTVESA